MSIALKKSRIWPARIGLLARGFPLRVKDRNARQATRHINSYNPPARGLCGKPRTPRWNTELIKGITEVTARLQDEAEGLEIGPGTGGFGTSKGGHVPAFPDATACGRTLSSTVVWRRIEPACPSTWATFWKSVQQR